MGRPACLFKMNTESKLQKQDISFKIYFYEMGIILNETHLNNNKSLRDIFILSKRVLQKHIFLSSYYFIPVQ